MDPSFSKRGWGDLETLEGKPLSLTWQDVGELILLDLESDLHVEFGFSPLFDGEELFFRLVFVVPGDKTQGFPRSAAKKLADIVFLESEFFPLKHDHLWRVFIALDFTCNVAFQLRDGKFTAQAPFDFAVFLSALQKPGFVAGL